MKKAKKTIQEICQEQQCACFSPNGRDMSMVCSTLYGVNLARIYRLKGGEDKMYSDLQEDAKYREWRIRNIEAIRTHMREIVMCSQSPSESLLTQFIP